jgi:serine protease Do
MRHTTLAPIMIARRAALLACPGIALMLTGSGVAAAEQHGGASVVAGSRATPSAARQTDFVDVVERVKPAVVGVRVALRLDSSTRDEVQRFLDGSGAPKAPGAAPKAPAPKAPVPQAPAPQAPGAGPQGSSDSSERAVLVSQGTGFFISGDGYIVTNHRLVANSKTVEIKTDDDKTLVARVVGNDPRSDLALLKVDGRTDFPSLRFADHAPRVGDWALAVGNPFGLGSTVTAGIVSARGRDIGPAAYQDLLQLDAPVNQGSSGGPTFNANGEVVGVITAILSPAEGSVGVGFATPAEEAKKVAAQLQSKGTVTRGWIGLKVQVVTPDIADGLGLTDLKGALVAEPQAGGPADKAGIKSGDVITSVNDQPIADTREFIKRIADAAPGTSVALTLVRKGQQQRVSVALGEFPNGPRGSASQRGFGPTPEPSHATKEM